MQFNIRHNFAEFRPPRWEHTDYERRYGPRNEGFIIEATDLDNAREVLRSDYRLNPTFCLIEAT